MRQRISTRIASVAFVTLLLAATLVSSGLAQAPTAHADVNDFVVESFDAEYTLSRDESGRSSLKTTEHIVAVFPDFDQNRGLIRDLTRVYDGHSTELQIVSVTDENGTPRNYTTEPYGSDFLSVIMAVPEGQFVHGHQHYVIEYTQRDVTRFFEDTAADEFYWDVNGTEWTQPFGRVSARLNLDPALGAALNGNVACYRGGFGSATQCEITQEGGGFSVNEAALGPGENVTMAIGFAEGTFAPAPAPEVPFLQRVPLLVWGGALSLIAAVATFIITLVRGRSAKTGRAIIAQYEPPKGVSVALAAEILRVRAKSMTATLLDFAVRRKLRLLHHAETDQYGAQALGQSELLSLEKTTFSRIFTGSSSTQVDPGTTLWFSRSSTRLGDAATKLKNGAKAEATSKKLVKKVSGKATLAVVILMLLALGLPLLHSLLLDNFFMMTILLAVGVNVLVWALIGAVATLGTMRRSTEKGALLLDHLNGLREFIRVAEADRIRMLQSASGAEVDEHFIVRVYERLLPYAVLFGFEREWQSELARYYRESTPDWVYGAEGRTFLTALPIVGLSQAVARAPVTRAVSSGSGSGGSFSSSSGGSSGGGFSGGGGGGGGGRGI